MVGGGGVLCVGAKEGYCFLKGQIVLENSKIENGLISTHIVAKLKEERSSSSFSIAESIGFPTKSNSQISDLSEEEHPRRSDRVEAVCQLLQKVRTTNCVERINEEVKEGPKSFGGPA